MTAVEIQKLIEHVQEQTPKASAKFGIFRYGASEEVFYIQGNKEGLALFAAELLKLTNREVDNDEEAGMVPISFQENWQTDDSEIFIHYVKLIEEPIPVVVPAAQKSTLSARLVPIGCIAFLLLLLAAVVIGIGTITKWIFD